MGKEARLGRADSYSLSTTSAKKKINKKKKKENPNKSLRLRRVAYGHGGKAWKSGLLPSSSSFHKEKKKRPMSKKPKA